MLANVARDLPLIAWYIGVLVFLEGLLSADNALVLAVMVRHLSRHDRRRVLQWGIWGAIGFRVVAVLLSTILLKLWYFKVIGGLYLLYLSASHFLSRGHSSQGGAEGSRPRAWLRGFWGTVFSVTIADIAFSIDSIFAAVAMADDFPDRFGDTGKLFIVLTGGVLGIITMRFVVRYFVAMLDRFPGLAEGAYVLVAWIGLKLTISGVFAEEYHIPEWFFWTVMLLIMVLSFVIKPKGATQESMHASDDFNLLETGDDRENEPGTAHGDDPDRKRPGDDPRPDPPGQDRDGTTAPPDDHAIAAEQPPDEKAL
jgi:YkoY family integral membrane protein